MAGRIVPETGEAHLGGVTLSDEEIRNISRIVITACGTSWHAGLIGEYMIEEYARIPVEVEYASEFRYRDPLVDPSTVVIVISQSGETADTLAAMREAQQRGAKALGEAQSPGSQIAEPMCMQVLRLALPRPRLLHRRLLLRCCLQCI